MFCRYRATFIALGAIIACSGCGPSDTAEIADPPVGEEMAKPFSQRVKEEGYDITFTEIDRGANYSLVKVDLVEGPSVGSSMFLMKCAYDIAKERDFKYFFNVDLEDDAKGDNKIFLTNDPNVPLKDLLGEDYSAESQEIFDDVEGYLSVWELGLMMGWD
jgi:hypothetical protein